jgi:type II secretory pathway pseudopilin PulG
MTKSFKKAFTLIELFLTVTILSVGIVLILKSYLSLASALNLAENKTEAVLYLDRQMDNLRLQGIETDITKVSLDSEVTLNNKIFNVLGEIQPIYQQAEGEEEQELEAIKQVNLMISWNQGAKLREEKLISYIASEEE